MTVGFIAKRLSGDINILCQKMLSVVKGVMPRTYECYLSNSVRGESFADTMNLNGSKKPRYHFKKLNMHPWCHLGYVVLPYGGLLVLEHTWA